jgi:hypothetical protein
MNGDVEQDLKKSKPQKLQKLQKPQTPKSIKALSNTSPQSKLDLQDEKCDEKGANIFLANMIHLFHVVVIVFVLLAPFSNIPAFLILHVTFSFSLIVHWYNNNNECSLTYMESKLRGLDRTESFTHKFISPLYDISKTEWSKLCYIITIVLMSVSIYYLYHSDKVSKAWQCFNDTSINPEYKQMPFYEKLIVGFNCFKPLLIWC